MLPQLSTKYSMNETPTELQWFALCERVKTLAQLRYCLYNLYLEGGFLFIEVESCDDETAKHIFIVNPEGDNL